MDELEFYSNNLASNPLRKLAKQMSKDIVNAYIEHDKGNIRDSVNNFFSVFKILFSDVTSSNIQIASELYLKSLLEKDKIEDEDNLTLTQKLTHPNWENSVNKLLSSFCKYLQLDKKWAHHTTQFYRLHGSYKKHNSYNLDYIKHIMEAEKILVKRIIGDTYWAKDLGGLFISLVNSHDKRDMNGYIWGRKLSEEYFFILLLAREGMDNQGKKTVW